MVDGVDKGVGEEGGEGECTGGGRGGGGEVGGGGVGGGGEVGSVRRWGGGECEELNDGFFPSSQNGQMPQWSFPFLFRGR